MKNFACFRVKRSVMLFSRVAGHFLSHIPSHISARFKSHVTYVSHAVTPKMLKLKRDISLTTATGSFKRYLVREVVAKQDYMIMRAA